VPPARSSGPSVQTGFSRGPGREKSVDMPTGRLHAVSGNGLVAGRGICLAPVTLLDPIDWTWPDDGGPEWPLCWICLALTC